jgi:biotin carboxylase
MKKVAFIGGSHSELLLLERTRALGFSNVCIATKVSSAVRHLVDDHLVVDYSNREAVLQACQLVKPDFICSGANDFAYLSAANSANLLGLPGYDPIEVAEQLHHKDKFKIVARELGMPVCKSLLVEFQDGRIIERARADLRLPVLVKPTDLTGGKGITILDTWEHLDAALAYAASKSRRKTVLIEEYFAGGLHCYSSIVEGGKIIFEHTDNEYPLANRFLVSASICPGTLPDDARRAMRAYTEKLIQRMALVDGVLHCQLLWNGESLRILEYTRRCSGDLYSMPIELSRGVDHSRMILSPYIGEKPSTRASSKGSPDFFARLCVHSSTAGYFTGEQFSEWFRKRLVRSVGVLDCGDHIVDPSVQKSSVNVLRFASPSEFHALLCEGGLAKHAVACVT